MKPIIIGLSGTELSDNERRQFAAIDPAGYILFSHNIASRNQLRALTDALRAISGRADLLILIDQEGGRVARLGAPDWPGFPASAVFDRLYDLAPMTAIAAARHNGEAIGLMLRDVGVSVNCAPVLDLCYPATDRSIGDRSFGADPMRVAALGKAMLDGMAAGGVTGVIKHMPGQGRATVDSHESLPIVSSQVSDLEKDLLPFKALSGSSIAMTGHVLYQCWDMGLCATLSPTIISTIIRGKIGFDGLLLSDDLHMEALEGSLAERASACLRAGCDIALACWARGGGLDEIADAVPDMPPHTETRLERAHALKAPDYSVDKMLALMDKRDALLAYAG